MALFILQSIKPFMATISLCKKREVGGGSGGGSLVIVDDFNSSPGSIRIVLAHKNKSSQNPRYEIAFLAGGGWGEDCKGWLVITSGEDLNKTILKTCSG